LCLLFLQCIGIADTDTNLYRQIEAVCVNTDIANAVAAPR